MFKKLKMIIARKLLSGLKGTFLYCDKCNSMFTKFYDVNKVAADNKVTVTYTVECLMCGAKAKVMEEWDMNSAEDVCKDCESASCNGCKY